MSTVGDILSTVGRYHDKCGGYLEYRGDIMMHVGKYHEYRGGYVRYHEYRGVFSTMGYSNNKRFPPRY